jgi:predicted PurR-regulated permease PerM
MSDTPSDGKEASMRAEVHRDITRTVLGVLFIGALIGSSLWILRPFLGATVWAATIVVATWPFMILIQKRLWNKRSLAVAVMTLLLLCVLVVPFTAAISTIVSNADEIAGLARSLATLTLPPPPDWVGKLPLIGGKVVQVWEKVVATGVQEAALKAAPYVGGILKWFLVRVGSLAILLVEFLLTVLLAAIMYAKGESAAQVVMRFGRRLAGPRGETSIRLAGQAVRGVALGVVVTALAQSILGGICLAIAGVPFAAILTVVMFMLAISQIGVLPVMGLSVLWLFLSGSTGWGAFLIVCTLVVGTMDNFLRPILIKKGADLPLLLIFTGVVGGLVAFGLIGLFIGPVVLAVAHKLLEAWVDEEPGGTDMADRQRPMAP